MSKLNLRQGDILRSLQQHEQLQIEDLALRFQVSQQTIRKDINQMCDIGLARRLHGGVALPAPLKNTSFDSREQKNAQAKRDIAIEVAKIIPNGASIMLGIGTTVLNSAAALLHHQDLRIVTNNLRVANVLCDQSNHDVYVAGGQLRPSDRDVVGETTTRFLDGFHVDIGVIGVGALDPDLGLMEYDPLEADIARAIARNSNTLLLVADQSKWHRTASVKSLRLDVIDRFITDELAPDFANCIPENCQVLTL